MSLAELKQKERVYRIQSVFCSGVRLQRLCDLGLCVGSEVQIKCVAPMGDPIVVRVGDCDVAIRKADAKSIVLVAV
ncbi:MAG: ferrous iron transport protein A [Firmicutes bacterium]|nr:ferrous iron transport protein A [Bacillota bacterium]